MSDPRDPVTAAESRIEKMIERVLTNHEARLLFLERVMSRRHTVVTATVAGVTSIVVALITALL